LSNGQKNGFFAGIPANRQHYLNHVVDGRFLVMDTETMKLAVDLADRITTVGFMLFMIAFLMKENSVLKELLFGDWKRQNEEEREALKIARQKSNGTGL
jgi:hypothetical protein